MAVQQAQGIFADGYTTSPLRTGYEQVIAHRTSPMFASTADEDGTVLSVKDGMLTVQYKSGSIVKFDLNKQFGIAAGVCYPHTLTTDLKEGDSFKSGSILTYNNRFFTSDIFNPGQVVLKTGIICKTALIDNIDTLEDGSVISERVAALMNTQTTEVRTIEVRFDQTVKELVELGSSVELDSVLCVIEDPEIADNPLFDQTSMDTLRRVSSMVPRAKVKGTVSKVEYFYHGDYDDLSPNLRELVSKYESGQKKRSKELGVPYFSGQVDSSFRIKGRALDPDTLAVRIYIDHDVSAGTGDKGVFGNQLKTVISRVMTGVNRAENGDEIDAIFGNVSIEARIVHSPKLMGTTNTLLRVLSKHVCKVYRGTTNSKAKEK